MIILSNNLIIVNSVNGPIIGPFTIKSSRGPI